MSSTVRISHSSWKILKSISTQAGEPMQAVLDKAVEEYRRQYFLKKSNEAYAALKQNTEKWQEEIREREVWEVSLGDGQREDV